LRPCCHKVAHLRSCCRKVAHLTPCCHKVTHLRPDHFTHKLTFWNIQARRPVYLIKWMDPSTIVLCACTFNTLVTEYVFLYLREHTMNTVIRKCIVYVSDVSIRTRLKWRVIAVNRYIIFPVHLKIIVTRITISHDSLSTHDHLRPVAFT